MEIQYKLDDETVGDDKKQRITFTHQVFFYYLSASFEFFCFSTLKVTSNETFCKN